MRFLWRAALFAASCTLPASSTLPLFGQRPVPAATGKDVTIGSPISMTFYVAPAHPAEAEAKAISIQTPGSKDYHQFLTRKQFVAEYAVSDADLKSIEGSLENLGLTIGYVYPNHLAIEVFGTVSAVQNALSIKLNTVTKDGKTGIVPDRAITLPASLQGKVRGVSGLNTLHHAHPMLKASVIPGQSTKRPAPAALVGGTPGNYLPADFEKFYDVDGIYNRGFKGRGTTIGIVTLANFNPADAYAFWKGIGLSVSQTRITKVDVDGGTQVPIDPNLGEGETDLDTEYSGAVAPDAKLRVYIAPNTNDSFINAFEAAASENLADTVSVSWGEAELDYFANPVSPFGGNQPSMTSLLDDFHDVFLEMALQGQTLFASSGDSGSFDTEEECSSFGTPSAKNPICNAPYAIDSPSSDPLVTAAGGTTLPFDFFTGSGVHLFVPQERAWAWDYILLEFNEQGVAFPLSDVFSVGDGGGVSSYFGVPWYQKTHPGITKTVSDQYLTVNTGKGPVLDLRLPSNFAGRNTPDLSSNADPESGYQLLSEGSILNFYGGTSFVAPQLNGVTALLVDALGERVGQINPALYRLNASASRDISAGDNWGYSAITGYDNAVGVGVLDALHLLTGLESLKQVK